MEASSKEEWVRRWWPLPTSLDLVRGPVERVADAVLTEIRRFVGCQELSYDWVPFTGLDNLFGSVKIFTNIPTVFFVIPTVSDWTILWNNCYGCDGYDSLCYCLTAHHNLPTLHWQASDCDGPFQAGSLFTCRRPSNGEVLVRSVYCGRNDEKWVFCQTGDPLPEEDVATYAARWKRERLDERKLLALLEALGARPREQTFYHLGRSFRIARIGPPSGIFEKSFDELAAS
jgi:hypothetical protein